MAVRPAFYVTESGPLYVEVKLMNFSWVPGMAMTQKQKCVDSLHRAIKARGAQSVLEVSSKSRDQLGVQLSAFNLGFTHPKNGQFVCVESAFQGSKVFEHGGPFVELFARNAREAKKFFKDKKLGQLVEFNFYGQAWPLNPLTLFYDWIYGNSLLKNLTLARQASEYVCFTDIEFNPKKSINCQAYSLALFVSLCRRGEMEDVLTNRDTYVHAMRQQPNWITQTDYGRHHTDDCDLML
jgi:hypothetical protein